MGNSSYRQNFDQGKKNDSRVKKMKAGEWVIPVIDKILIKARRTKSNTTARKSVLELLKLQTLVAKCCKCRLFVVLLVQIKISSIAGIIHLSTDLNVLS